MSQVRDLRNLLGDYYSSVEDFKEEKLQTQLNTPFRFPIKIKKHFKPNKKEVKTFFYTILNNPLRYLPQELSRYFFNEHNSKSEWFSFNCLFYFEDEVEVKFFTNNNKMLAQETFTIVEKDFKVYKMYPEEHEDGFLEIKLINRPPEKEKEIVQEINEVKKTVKNFICTNLLPLAFMHEFSPKGVKANKAQKSINLKYKIDEKSKPYIIKFMKQLKIELLDSESLDNWRQKVENSEINWGYKDLFEYKALYQYWNNTESSFKIARGQTNIKHLLNSIDETSNDFRQNLKSMIQLLKKYQKE